MGFGQSIPPRIFNALHREAVSLLWRMQRGLMTKPQKLEWFLPVSSEGKSVHLPTSKILYVTMERNPAASCLWVTGTYFLWSHLGACLKFLVSALIKLL